MLHHWSVQTQVRQGFEEPKVMKDVPSYGMHVGLNGP